MPPAPKHMSEASNSTARGGRAAGPDPGPAAGSDPTAGPDRIAARDEHGQPIHRGWMPLAGRRRWIEPFVLALLARGGTYGYAILGRLEEMHVSNGTFDVGLVYRTLRDLERDGLVSSTWAEESAGPRRRAYELTAAGVEALDDWAVVMRERARLIGEFNADYLEVVSQPRGDRGDRGFRG